MIRRGFEANTSLFYYQTKEGHEVDFLIRNASGEIELLQVSYNLESAKTKDRELRSLLSAKAELGAASCKVITMGQWMSEVIKGEKIEIIGIADWLTS